MADIFLSYSSQDRERITPLIQSLEQQGWLVWWDRQIPPGKTYDQVIEQALDEARCVVVVWAQTSVLSEWVKVEADEGMNRKILVPVLIDEAKIPLAYRRIQAARLIDWQSSSPHPELDLLFKAIRAIVGEPETAKKESKREQVRNDATAVSIQAPESAQEQLPSAKSDEEISSIDSPPLAPVFTPPVQPTSIHSIPAVRHFDRSSVREPEPRNDEPVSFEKVRLKRDRSPSPEIPSGRKKAWLAADRQIFARIIAVALDLLMPLSVIGVIRILPVPYKLWVVVGFIFVWRLLCDLTVFNFGKFFADLSVVSAKGGTCAPWQVATRQAPHAMAQAACTLGFLDLTAKGLGWQVLLDPISVPWPAFAQSNSFAPVLMLSALVYALVSLACAWISTEGRRIEDFIFGTRVIRSRRR